MDSLHTVIALAPLATYLLVLGMINVSPRPLLTTGARDAAALAVGIAGFVVVGPLELFLVEAAAAEYGGWVWAIMLTAYGLIVLLIVLLLRPRLVVYNITAEQLRPVLVDVMARIDPEARWAGESVASEQCGIQLYMDALPVMKTVSLVASGGEQNLIGWQRLQGELALSLRGATTGANPLGPALLSFGLLMAGAMTWLLASDSSGVLQAMNEMLRR